MAPNSSLFGGSLLALFLACGCSGGNSDASAESTGEPALDATAARELRIARDLERANWAVRRSEEFGRLDEFLGPVKRIWEESEKKTPFQSVSDGWIRTEYFGVYEIWNAPGADRELPLADDIAAEGHPFQAITRYAKAFNEHGIELLVVPTPNRLQVHPELVSDITAGSDFVGLDPGHFRFVRALIEAGVEVLDLLPDFAAARDRDLFWRFDHHWNPAGCELGAELVAERIKSQPWFEQGPAREGVDFQVVRETAAFTPKLPTRLEMEPGTEEKEYARVLGLDGERLDVTADRTSPILIIGDSSIDFLEEESIDFARKIYAHTGHPVDAVAIPGGATDQVWRALQRRGDGLAGKRIVIWVFSVGRLLNRRWPYLELFDA